MQKFGFEIRKAGSFKNLYDDVDSILGRLGKGIVPDKVKIAAVAHSLQNMLRAERHFNICTVKDCATLCQIVISKERLDLYHTVHCISYSEMLPEFREALVAMILDDFRCVLNQNP